MIKTINDAKEIAKVWNNAFGDSFEDIEIFVNEIAHAECIAYYENDNIASMLYVIKCKLLDTDYYYLYAVSTIDTFRGNGYSSKLISYAKNKYQRLCLIPANEGLIIFYRNRGFDKSTDLDEIEFNQSQTLINDYLFEGCELKNPMIMYCEG